VTVGYTGRPGVHNDGDGTTEGWFRAPDGGFVTTEPVASEDWMPVQVMAPAPSAGRGPRSPKCPDRGYALVFWPADGQAQVRHRPDS
jgi:hypothetical protein